MLFALLPQEIEALLAGDLRQVENLIGYRYPPDDPTRGVDLNWHLRALRAVPGAMRDVAVFYHSASFPASANVLNVTISGRKSLATIA